jgi:hypothetical protein
MLRELDSVILGESRGNPQGRAGSISVWPNPRHNGIRLRGLIIMRKFGLLAINYGLYRFACRTNRTLGRGTHTGADPRIRCV